MCLRAHFVAQSAPRRGMRCHVDISEQLLRVLGSVLDIRKVFPQVSDRHEALLHDRSTMSLHDGDQTRITHAASNDDGPMLVRVQRGIETLQDGWSRIVDDLRVSDPGVVFDPPDHARAGRPAIDR